MEFITDFGDSAVILPLSAAVMLCLVWGRWFSAALRWGLAVGGCGIVMVALKIGFLACAAQSFQGLLHSPSGHAAMSATVYGALAGLVAARCRREWVVLPYAVAHLLIMAIALSRIAVLAHSPLEVMVGLGVGTLFATAFTIGLGPPPSSAPSRFEMGVGVATVLTVTHGARLQIEAILMSLAFGARATLCP